MLKSKAIKTLPRRALNEVADAGFSVKGLYLDRQFYTVDIITYLQDKKIPLSFLAH